jgi:hypothetical protein
MPLKSLSALLLYRKVLFDTVSFWVFYQPGTHCRGAAHRPNFCKAPVLKKANCMRNLSFFKMLGSILSNLLLVLGCSFLAGSV